MKGETGREVALFHFPYFVDLVHALVVLPQIAIIAAWFLFRVLDPRDAGVSKCIILPARAMMRIKFVIVWLLMVPRPVYFCPESQLPICVSLHVVIEKVFTRQK